MVSCIEDLGVFVGESGSLIVDGLITNEPGPHVIQLTMTREFNTSPDYDAVEGADVRVISEDGVEIKLNDTFKGVYETPEAFIGKVGTAYQLKVRLNSGAEYYSDFETLSDVPVIDSIYYENVQKEVLSEEDVLFEETRVGIFIDYCDDEQVSNYYRWRYLETYEIYAPKNNAEEVSVRGCSYTQIVSNCWVDDYDSDFLAIQNDFLMNGQDIIKQEIFSAIIDRKFAIGYSVEIQQYSLTQQAYEYWEAIENQLENNGTIFETNNYQIRGNIHSSEENELVLGYFEASAVSRKRLLLVDSEVQYNYAYVCEPNENNGCFPEACVDCTKYNASSNNVKPDFWP